MKPFYTFLCALGSVLLFGFAASAQDSWPKTVTMDNGTVIKLYQLQPESFTDNTLQAKAAISVLENGKSDPVFGMAWLKATTSNNGNTVQIQSAQITNIKLPGESADSKLDDYANALEQKIGSGGISIARSDLQTSLETGAQEAKLSQEISNTPPKVLYSTNPSILVLIDGAPQLQRNNEWGLDAVVNTPFTIVKNSDGRFYLYGGKHWYTAPAATGPYAMVTDVPSKLNSIAQQVNDAASKNDAAGNTEKETDENTMYKIIVSTDPAELIQSNGEANFSPVQGTDLLYVSNSEDDIFMDTQSQQYYVLISGRWYKSKTLSGNWQYTAADKLPADFAQIPEGSPKDNVLSSVAGTQASQDALQDAEVPQTAKVDRQQAKADVMYDGDPQFEDIDGTDMDYAVNTSASVIRWRNRYYSVDNGIWFESYSATGPWSVCVNRPYVVSLIPPRYPVYNMKYVYIYDVTPDYVYMGYTPGYLNTYIYGSTIVYGTGYYYRPWFRNYYFPRPYTWGFGIRYNPWIGWGFGFNYNSGWFHASIGYGSPWGYGYGGWWGPRVYRPSYCYAPYRTHGGYYGGGYYSRNYRSSVNINIVNINRTNNIYNHSYRNRGAITTHDNQRTAFNNNRGRDFNRNGGYTNRSNNNFNNNRGSGRFDNNNNRGGNDNRPGNREYRPNNYGSQRNNNGIGNNNSNFSRRDNNNGNGQAERPTRREWNPVGDNRGGNGSTTPGTSIPRQNRERIIRNNDNQNNGGRPDFGNGRGNPDTRQPRVEQPQQPRNSGGGWEGRGGGNPGRVMQPQPSQQPQTRPSFPQRSAEPSRGGGGGESRGGGNGGGGGSRPSRGGGEQHSSGGGGGNGGHGRRG